MKSGDSFGICLTDRAACAGIVLAYADVWLEAGLEERWLARRVNLDASSTALAAEKSYREAGCALGHDETTENGAAHPLWIAEQRGYDKRIEELTSYMIQPDAQYRHRWRKGVRASTRDVTLSLHLC